MAKLTRKTAIQFGNLAGVNQIAQFGSLAANGSPGTFSTDPAVIQNLSVWQVGWFSAVIGGNAPTIEDMNAAFYVAFYQIANSMERGVPDYDSGTTYYKGAIVNDGAGLLYASLTDSNAGNALTSSSNWAIQGLSVTKPTTAAAYSILQADSYIRMNNTGGVVYAAMLPASSSTPVGKRFTIKNISTDGTGCNLAPSGSDTIEGANANWPIGSTPEFESITVVNIGSGAWDII